MDDRDRFRRYELKYFVSPDEMCLVRAMVAPFMRPDEYGLGRPGNCYTVRSIYSDTRDLRFYHEKEAGLKIRKKLRLRTYNRYQPDSVAFFEIKRKHGQTIMKERVGMGLDQALELSRLDPDARAETLSRNGLGLTPGSRASLDRFFFLTDSLMLRRTVLVVYEREAYVGRENPRVRVTLDCDVRSIIRPDLDDIFAERDLRHLSSRRQILEVKFDGWMPPWLRPVTTRLNRSYQPISKYCRGIDLWAPVTV
jgi:hypothetical protein